VFIITEDIAVAYGDVRRVTAENTVTDVVTYIAVHDGDVRGIIAPYATKAPAYRAIYDGYVG